MPLKKGQKLTDNPKNVQIGFRLTQQEADDLQYCANELGICRTEVLNMGVQLIKKEIEKKKG